MRYSLPIVALFLLTLIPTSTALWSSPRGSPWHDGFVEGTSPHGFYLLWELSIGSPTTIEPVIGHPQEKFIAYLPVNATRQLLAIDLERGDVVWSTVLIGHPTTASYYELGDACYVVVADDAGYLYCFNAASGQLYWNCRLDAPIYASPLTTSNKTFVCTSEGTVYAIDLQTGGILWTNETIAAEIRYAGPTLLRDNETLVVVTERGRIFHVNSTCGRVSYVAYAGEFGTPTSLPTALPIGGSSTGDWCVFCTKTGLVRVRGTMIYKTYDFISLNTSAPTGIALYRTELGSWVAYWVGLDPERKSYVLVATRVPLVSESMENLWYVQLNGPPSPPTATKDRVFVGDASGYLYIVDHNGTIRARIELGDAIHTAPIFVPELGYLLVGVGTKLVCLSTDTTPPTITELSLKNGTVLSSPSGVVAFYCSVKDNFALRSCAARIDGGAWVEKTVSGIEARVGWTFTDLTEGGHTIEINVTDLAGLSRLASVFFTIDNTPPEVTIVDPTDGALIRSSTVHVCWTASNDVVCFYVQVDDQPAVNVGLANEYEFHDLPDGEHTIKVYACDIANNTAVDIVHIRVRTNIFAPILPYVPYILGIIVVAAVYVAYRLGYIWRFLVFIADHLPGG